MNRAARRANKKAALALLNQAVVGRECGECSECCTSLTIEAIMKPEGQRCKSLVGGQCVRYASRPKICAEYFCLWRFGFLDEAGRPDKIGLVISLAGKDQCSYLVAMARERAIIHQQSEMLEALALERDQAIVCRVVGSRAFLLTGSMERCQELVALQRKIWSDQIVERGQDFPRER